MRQIFHGVRISLMERPASQIIFDRTIQTYYGVKDHRSLVSNSFCFTSCIGRGHDKSRFNSILVVVTLLREVILNTNGNLGRFSFFNLNRRQRDLIE
ncbi:hypothetical protein BST14_27915 [Mycobacterium arosiense ATCC BAA-1401 = DSM 45069]|uniref:Uncharacterized protein n=1 Tax=Mycobacterium arosiense ATCC BAA-1401 = DSM 45069 TaxID=1265311 RepID=A0A1W9Z4U9_MYCAI|nr:hypothetical protein BST14_27915 [Mycobacterium arosiense ATCC BAA-1401 = DSM 45069]